MASTFDITRNQLIFGLGLPLAILMGFRVAEPFASTSLTALLMLAAVLVVPALMPWDHPLWFLNWNMTMVMAYLPGKLLRFIRWKGTAV